MIPPISIPFLNRQLNLQIEIEGLQILAEQIGLGEDAFHTLFSAVKSEAMASTDRVKDPSWQISETRRRLLAAASQMKETKP